MAISCNFSPSASTTICKSAEITATITGLVSSQDLLLIQVSGDDIAPILFSANGSGVASQVFYTPVMPLGFLTVIIIDVLTGTEICSTTYQTTVGSQPKSESTVCLNQTIEIFGTVLPNATVNLLLEGNQVDSTTAAADGSYEFNQTVSGGLGATLSYTVQNDSCVTELVFTICATENCCTNPKTLVGACCSDLETCCGDGFITVSITEICCDDQPVNPQTNPLHCGDCATQCGSCEICQAGACVSTCLPGQKCCNGLCVAIQTDHENCGDCNKPCGACETCVAGGCVGNDALCPPNQKCCDGTCAILGVDAHCSTCDACPTDKPKCDADKKCVECLVNCDCKDGKICVNKECKDVTISGGCSHNININISGPSTLNFCGSSN